MRIPNTSPTYTANFTVQPANGFLATVTNSSGQRLPRIYYSVSWRKTGTTDPWEYPQYGPLATDENGQVWWAMKPGYRYRFCLSDTDYSVENTPAVRYANYCWKDATT